MTPEMGWIAGLLGLAVAATTLFVTRWEHIDAIRRIGKLEEWHDLELYRRPRDDS